jgi:hypothetical protein
VVSFYSPIPLTLCIHGTASMPVWIAVACLGHLQAICGTHTLQAGDTKRHVTEMRVPPATWQTCLLD